MNDSFALSGATDENRVCPVCASGGSTIFRKGGLPKGLGAADLQVTDSHYGTTLSLLRCRACGFLYADPRETRRLTALYEALDDPQYLETQDSRLLQMRWLLDLGRRAKPEAATLLDVGAGVGSLVREARERGLDATGIEPCASFVNAAEERAGVRLMKGTLPHPELADRKFDLVYLVDVIEHVADPVRLLMESRKLLSSGGAMVVVTPDVASLAARIFGRRWWHFRAAHVGFFHRRSFGRAVERAGLEILSCRRAKWFFRVDYLAERLTKYLPISRFNEWARRRAFFRRLYDKIIPLNLFDSYVFFLGSRHDG